MTVAVRHVREWGYLAVVPVPAGRHHRGTGLAGRRQPRPRRRGAVGRAARWEERFGALLVTVDDATPWVSVGAPPRTEKECLYVAAEHVAFCPGVDGEDPRPLQVYAGTLRDADSWRFWWD